MNKQEFLKRLARKLSGLRKTEIEEHSQQHGRYTSEALRTAIGELQREFTGKIGDQLQNCGITSFSKLTAESVLTLPESVHSLS